MKFTKKFKLPAACTMEEKVENNRIVVENLSRLVKENIQELVANPEVFWIFNRQEVGRDCTISIYPITPEEIESGVRYDSVNKLLVTMIRRHSAKEGE